MNRLFAILIPCIFVTAAPAEEAVPQPRSFTHRIIGLFEPGRETDLRAALEKVPGITLASVDLAHGEGVFTYDPAVAFKDTKPEKITEKFDEWVRNASRSMFSILPVVATPRDKLTRVEIVVAPIDCKACALAWHEIVVKTDGVAQATVNRKDGRITALIDPEKTSLGKLEELLKKREIRLATP